MVVRKPVEGWTPGQESLPKSPYPTEWDGPPPLAGGSNLYSVSVTVPNLRAPLCSVYHLHSHNPKNYEETELALKR